MRYAKLRASQWLYLGIGLGQVFLCIRFFEMLAHVKYFVYASQWIQCTGALNPILLCLEVICVNIVYLN